MTDPSRPPGYEHVVTVQTGITGMWFASCSCRWRSQRRTVKAKAEALGAAHQAKQSGESGRA